MRRFFLVFVLAILLIPASAFGQVKRPLDHDAYDIWMEIEDQAISHDGRWVAYRVSHADSADNSYRADLWLSATDGSAERRLTWTDRAAESQATFSPDGRHLAFVSKRADDQASQIYVLGLDRLTSVPVENAGLRIHGSPPVRGAVSEEPAPDPGFTFNVLALNGSAEDGEEGLPTDGRDDEIPEMELQPFEHYDYIMLVFRNDQDFSRACELLDIQEVQVKYPGGKSKIGLGRVVEGAKALETLCKSSSPPEDALARFGSEPSG